MEVEFSISGLTDKLQDLVDVEAPTVNPRLSKQVHTAIENLEASKHILKHVDVVHVAKEDDKMIIQLLEAIYSTETATDLFLMTKEFHHPDVNSWLKFVDSRKMKSLCNPILFEHKLKRLNKEFKSLVEMIMKEEARSLKIQNNRPFSLSSRQLWGGISEFYLEEETHFVGIQPQINELVDRLINEGQSSKVIVIGKEGVGKTTLVRSVYNRIDVKGHFSHRAWARIPSVFKTKDLLADIYKQINQAEFVMEATLDEYALTWKLTKSLEGSLRHLIVLEDVNAPQVRGSGLLDILNSSSSHADYRIILITCEEEANLSPLVGHHSILRVCQLNDQETWKLFSHKVGISEDELNQSQLVKLKKQILKICNGSPLLIVLVGGLLSTKEQSYNEWSRVLTTSEDVIDLCYQDLPLEVKPCFLYMRIFPRGFEIPVRRLIHLWCAEGFVTPSNPNNLAEKYLEELVTRKMVQVRWRLDGTPKTCYMHNGVYDFFSEAACIGLRCHHVQDSPRASAVRRLVAYAGINYFHSPLQNLRSCIAFDSRQQITARDIDMLLNKTTSSRGFGLLTVLDLEGVFQPKLSDNVVRKLLQLSYLGLRSTFMDYLPHALECLHCLETLDMKHTNVGSIKLPNSNRLQHIYLNRYYREICFNENSRAKVQTLRGLNISYSERFDYLFNMNELADLGMTYCTSTDYNLKLLAEWIYKQTKLQSLKFRSIDVNGRHSIIELRSMAHHLKLQKLYLLGNLSQSIVDVCFLPPNMRKLTLSLSGLEKDPMPVLGQLPHLNILRLFSGSYKGEQMTCLSRGFPRLRQLKLWKLRVQVWTVEEGAMTCLGQLEIRRCDKLQLPQGLQNVTTLKEVVLTNMPSSFVTAVKTSLPPRDVYIQNNAWNSRPLLQQSLSKSTG